MVSWPKVASNGWRRLPIIVCVPSALLSMTGAGRASTGSTSPPPGWSMVLLSPYSPLANQTSMPFWYGKRSTQSGFVVPQPKLYGPVFSVAS